MRPALALLGAVLLAACGGGEEKPLGPKDLVAALQDGGYVVFVRHGVTDRSREDTPGAPLSDCSQQRNLNALGRAQSREMGRAIRDLGIPVGSVLTSGYCRTRETAELAFGRGEVDDDLTGIPSEAAPARRERFAKALRQLLSEPPEDGTNTFIVGHITNFEAATGFEIEEGDSAIFEPLGDGRFRLAGTLPAVVWPQLAGAAGR